MYTNDMYTYHLAMHLPTALPTLISGGGMGTLRYLLSAMGPSNARHRALEGTAGLNLEGLRND